MNLPYWSITLLTGPRHDKDFRIRVSCRFRRAERNGVGRNSGRLPSAARRRRCASAPFPPSLRLRSTFSTRRPQTEASSRLKHWKIIYGEFPASSATCSIIFRLHPSPHHCRSKKSRSIATGSTNSLKVKGSGQSHTHRSLLLGCSSARAPLRLPFSLSRRQRIWQPGRFRQDAEPHRPP